MNKAKITWGTNYRTAQIYSNGPELALCSDDNRQIGTFVFCKDFFQDAIVAALHGFDASIYSYTYSPKTCPPVPTQNVKVLLANGADAKFLEKAPAVIDFLHQFETAVQAKTPLIKSEIWQAEDVHPTYKNGVLLIAGDPIWMLAPPLLSAWTLIARNGLQHTVGVSWEKTVDDIINGKVAPAQKNDNIYLKHGLPGLKKIIADGIEACFGKDKLANYPKDTAGSTMHHYSGIVSYGSLAAQSYFPNWKYPEPPTEKAPAVCFS